MNVEDAKPYEVLTVDRLNKSLDGSVESLNLVVNDESFSIIVEEREGDRRRCNDQLFGFHAGRHPSSTCLL